mgnify:CR=1 FL=1
MKAGNNMISQFWKVRSRADVVIVSLEVNNNHGPALAWEALIVLRSGTRLHGFGRMQSEACNEAMKKYRGVQA